MAFRIGDRVWWETPCNGNPYRKEGVVVAVVPPGQAAIKSVTESMMEDCSIPSDGFGDMGRPEESYVVKVQDGNRKPRLYWPRVKHLRRVEE